MSAEDAYAKPQVDLSNIESDLIPRLDKRINTQVSVPRYDEEAAAKEPHIKDAGMFFTIYHPMNSYKDFMMLVDYIARVCHCDVSNITEKKSG